MIQVYTGNGKGKTTAALGLALRAAGAGAKVFIAQFVKGRRYSELAALKKIKNIRLAQFGKACFIKKKPGKNDIKLARCGLEKIREIISKRSCDVLILDEINIAINLGLLDCKEVIAIIKSAPSDLEFVLTGRYARPEIIKISDLVSEIKEVKHYYAKGVKARKGIEF
jgi:cob(I)alamin adenosyltransferase